MKRYKKQYVNGVWVVLDCREDRVVDIVHSADTAIRLVEYLNNDWLRQTLLRHECTKE
jgi:hypothetical protein